MIVTLFYLKQEVILNEKILPYVEMTALKSTARVSFEKISAETKIPVAQLRSFFGGCRLLTIDEMNAVRDYLTATIRGSVAAPAGSIRYTGRPQ